MKKYRYNPHLFEINAVLFLKRMQKKYHKKKLTLLDIPDIEWQTIADQGFNFIWLMGVWKRSLGAHQWALSDPNLRNFMKSTYSRYTKEDIIASGYAIYDYSLDPLLGDSSDLVLLKGKLNKMGIFLILDFVPNHLAFDHPWTLAHPGRFIRGTAKSCKKYPDVFFQTKKNMYLAHGKDPNFVPWIDTVQINFFTKLAREALLQELRCIAMVCDGVRCDMAMLVLNEIFHKTWSPYIELGELPKTEFWQDAITEIKREHPEFLFLAEVYWNREEELIKLGFDYVYDKILYDRLHYDNAESVRGHLCANMDYQQRAVRFLENHDEQRAIELFGKDKSMAAAAIAYTVPGMRMFFDGQKKGYKVRLPIQSCKDPQEMMDLDIMSFYDKLLEFTDGDLVHEGNWQLLDCVSAWAGNGSHQEIIASIWEYQEHKKLIVVNYSSVPAQAKILLPNMFSSQHHVIFHDIISRFSYIRESKVLRREGLYVALDPWQPYLFEVL